MHIAHPFPLDQRPPTVSGGMEHEEQKDPVAQSTSVYLTTSAADFSKETLVVKEEETYDAGVFERVKADVVKLLSES